MSENAGALGLSSVGLSCGCFPPSFIVQGGGAYSSFRERPEKEEEKQGKDPSCGSLLQ